MNRQLAFAILALLTSTAAGADRIIFGESFDAGLAGWSGSGIFWDDLNGHLTPNGSARIQDSGTRSIQSPCVNLEDQPLYTSVYRWQASAKATTTADLTRKAEAFSDPDCIAPINDLSLQDSLAENSWERTEMVFLTDSLTRSVRFQFDFSPTGFNFFGSFIDDVRLFNRAPEEMLRNAAFRDNLDHWFPIWGELTHETGPGFLPAPGFARVAGHVDNFAGIRHECIDLTDHPDPGGLFRVIAAVKPDPGSTDTHGGVVIDYFTNASCTAASNPIWLTEDLTPGSWTLVDRSFSLPAGTQSIRVVLLSLGVPEGGVTLFDDASLYLVETVFVDGFESGNTSRWSSTTN